MSNQTQQDSSSLQQEQSQRKQKSISNKTRHVRRTSNDFSYGSNNNDSRSQYLKKSNTENVKGHINCSTTNIDEQTHDGRRDIFVASSSKSNNTQLTMSPKEMKIAGNKLCALHKYDEAILYYTHAIEGDPNEPIFFSNRGLCYLKLQQWTQAVLDCRRTLELDNMSIKGHFFLGQALAELENFDEALKHLQRAHDLAREKNINFGDDISFQIRLTKRRKWNKVEENDEKFARNLQTYILNLVRKDYELKLKMLTENLDSLVSPSSSSSSQHTPTNDEIVAKQTQISTEEADFNSKYDKIVSIFTNLEIQSKKRDVPDYLCGKISFEIMQDPVITPSGITYDREDIEEHLKRVGHFDPVTRQPLRPEHLIPNLVMKEVVDAYLHDNEWAKYY